MRIALLAIGIVLLAVGASGQVTNDPELLGQLKKLFPDAATFSAKTGSPAHYKAFGPAAGGQQEGALLGLAYWTTELEPLERGFDGPIKMLVGLNTAGEITGVIVTDHREPYGYFSVDLPELAEAVRGQEHPRRVQGRRRRRRDLARDDHRHEREPRDPQRVAQGRSRASRTPRSARGRHRARRHDGPVNQLLERAARCGVAVLRTLLVCMLLPASRARSRRPTNGPR